MTLEIVIVGLAAIVASEELDCQHPMLTVLRQTEPIDVVLLNPGLPHMHEAYLWARIDGLVTEPAARNCWHGNEKLPPQPGTDPVMDCSTLKDKKWARYPLAGQELRIIQQNTQRATLNLGHRKLGGRCWGGKRPGDADSCKSSSTEARCKQDLSWLPEYSKVSSGSRIRPTVLDDPASERVVQAIVRDLRGDLGSVIETTSDAWKWDWNYPSCGGDVPAYEQVFAQMAMFDDVIPDVSTLYLIDLRLGTEQTIALTGDPRLVVSNLPAHPVKLVLHGEKCYLPHFDLISTVVESTPTCRRLPYLPAVDNGGRKECPTGAIGMADQFCPPVLLLRPAG